MRDSIHPRHDRYSSVVLAGLALALLGGTRAASAQNTAPSGASSKWEPSVYAGAWSLGSTSRRPSEPALGVMTGLDFRRTKPARRSSFVATVKGYTKDRGRFRTDSRTQPREHAIREYVVTAGIGVDWDLTQSPQRWFVGLGGSAATSRQSVREVTSTGLPYSQFGDDERWHRITGVVSARTGYTIRTSRQWGLRLIAEVFQGVETITERGPMFTLSVGVVRRR